MAYSTGLKKDPELVRWTGVKMGATNGRKYGFQPGQGTWNKGKHHSPPGSEKTWFRKGDMPKTWKPVGSERRERDGIWFRKVADTRDRKTDWRPIHYLVWEQHHGPVPEDHIIAFKNQNHDDNRIENLECITRAENMRRNQYQRYPEPIATAIQLRGALNRQINQRSRP